MATKATKPGGQKTADPKAKPESGTATQAAQTAQPKPQDTAKEDDNGQSGQAPVGADRGKLSGADAAGPKDVGSEAAAANALPTPAAGDDGAGDGSAPGDDDGDQVVPAETVVEAMADAARDMEARDTARIAGDEPAMVTNEPSMLLVDPVTLALQQPAHVAINIAAATAGSAAQQAAHDLMGSDLEEAEFWFCNGLAEECMVMSENVVRDLAIYALRRPTRVSGEVLYRKARDMGMHAGTADGFGELRVPFQVAYALFAATAWVSYRTALDMLTPLAAVDKPAAVVPSNFQRSLGSDDDNPLLQPGQRGFV